MAGEHVDSIMDVEMSSFLSFVVNTEEISDLQVSMEDVTAATIPQFEPWTRTATSAPKLWACNATENKVLTNALENLQKALMAIPNSKVIFENTNKSLERILEKQKVLEAEVVKAEMRRDAQKKILAEEISSLQALKEETKNAESQLETIQNKIQSLTKEREGLKHQNSSSDKENSSTKKTVDLYRQLTGVTFDYNVNCPQELKGFAAAVGPTTNLKTFSFNTSEHSTSLMSGYIWNVLEDMHKKNWENVGNE